MKRISVLAMIVAMLVAGSAIAGQRLTIAPNASFLTGAPTTTNNDDSCDIGTYPAATLLLPYFAVDLTATAGTGRNTLMTITNVSRYSQIAHVTVWTDWSAPVLDFNLFLTGYDVVPISLYDVIARGLIPTTSTLSPNTRGASGTSSSTAPNAGTTPQQSAVSPWGNPNFAGTVGANCGPGRLPGQLPPNSVADIRAALSTGTATGTSATCSGTQVGSNHGSSTAIGYITIDVNNDCNTSLPNDPTYFTRFILFDNVLTGEYEDLSQNTATGNYAGGNPMVHIRAIPEGGPAGQAPGTNLPFTFYDRYTAGGALGRTVDRRQPLPSAFAARWIAGTSGVFDTKYKIWREGFTGSLSNCDDYAVNDAIPVAEVVRFDERENAGIVGSGIIFSPFTPGGASTRETEELTVAASTVFPQLTTTDAGGWMYMNLNNGGNIQSESMAGLSAGGTDPFSAQRAGFGSPATATPFGRDVSQNWAIVSMFAEGRYGVDFDATSLGNGCSPALAGSGSAPIGPSGGALIGTNSNNYLNGPPNSASTNATP